MGGVRLTRITRPVALLGAMATLLAALFICLAAGGGAHPRHHEPPASGAAAYVCPYEQGDCGLFPRDVPAVLTAPPLDAPAPAAVQDVHPAPPRAGAASGRPDARPRAPDLHVLQVLRT
ncbi:hypothetical protein GCM10010331_10170 [Streptomyces xanthochromogenes]|uniref:hypothetical protein n=1 Tax=Streptomyces xanthochromogenes TaxID=67384 RepID=UPI001677DE75|nr:hypothetical protein [Streptomyces xanthochromogenes]GHB26073.1 hypothetical protein GCM10010331_10170 [Streptomyces xanthochromogenes]